MIRYRRIGIFVGHSILKDGRCTSADGVKNEYYTNKVLGANLKDWFDKVGQPCDLIIVPERKYGEGYEDDYKLPIANSGKYDLIIELHLNSYDGKAHGSEVLYKSSNGKIVAQRVQNQLKQVWEDRGLKYRDNLYMLIRTKPVSIMIESFFCDSASDCAKFDKIGSNELARRIASGILDTEIKAESAGGAFDIGDYQKNVRITADVLNVRTGRGTAHPVVNQFHKGDIVEVWYIGYQDNKKGDKSNLWGSCASGKRDNNGKPITGFIHMGFAERV